MSQWSVSTRNFKVTPPIIYRLAYAQSLVQVVGKIGIAMLSWTQLQATLRVVEVLFLGHAKRLLKISLSQNL
jgi:hypothetical protein